MGDTSSSHITRMIVSGGSYTGRISSSAHFAHLDMFYVFLAHCRHMRMRANSFFGFQLTQVAGTGCIMRVMTDRRIV